MIREIAAHTIRLVCGVPSVPDTNCPGESAVYFANHSSHLDFAAIWAALPRDVRARTRPVAGRDYWDASQLRRWLAADVFHAVLIERRRVTSATNPLSPMLDALNAGSSLIVFPEGTRSTDGAIGAFKPGLFHLLRARPETPAVPVLLQNLNRILPKGDFLPVPLIASLRFGGPIRIGTGEPKQAFLERARSALLKLGD